MKYLVMRLEHIVEYLMLLALSILVITLFGNVVMRYIFNSGMPAAEEIARLMFVWMIFLGAILALRRNTLLGIDLVQAKLPSWAQRGCAVVSHLLILYALWLFLYGSWVQTVIGTHTYSTVLGYPTALMASSGLICAASMMLIVASNLWRILSKHPGAVIPGANRSKHVATTDELIESGGAS